MAGTLVSNCWVWDVHERISNANCLTDPITCTCAQWLQSRLTLRDAVDQPGSSVLGILQAKMLEWVAMSSSRDLPDPGTEPGSSMSPAVAGGFFITRATWQAP